MAEVHAVLSCEINPDSANRFMQFLFAQATSPPDGLAVAVNCPGGNVVAGIAIYNAMMAMPYPITAHNIGNVDSIANVIFLAGSKRYACEAATFMFHGVGFNGNANERLEEKNIREKLDSIVSNHKRIARLISTRTTLTERQGTNLFKEQTTRDALWAKNNGVVSDIRDFVFPAGGNPFMFTQ